MHFQDCYNFDVQRAKRCVIPYSTPEGLIPFCTYNCGPEYRRFVEFTNEGPPAGRGRDTGRDGSAMEKSR